MKSCCNISIQTNAPACSRANPINAVKSITFCKTDFKDRYGMTFTKFLKLVKDQPDLSIVIISNNDNIGGVEVFEQECTIKGGIYSATFNIW